MKEISWSEFRLMKLADLKAGECLKVTGDGLPAFYAIINPQGGMVARVEGIASQIDTSRGLG